MDSSWPNAASQDGGGEPAAVEAGQLVVLYHAELYRYAYRLTGSACDAEDLTQQTFLQAQQNLAQLRSTAHARAWLYTIARNSYLKSRERRRPVLASVIEFSLEHVPQAALAEQAIESETLQRALNELRDEFKIVLLMFYFEDLSYREIAARLDVPLGTVMSRLARAKAQLRSRLSAQTADDGNHPVVDDSISDDHSTSDHHNSNRHNGRPRRTAARLIER